MRSRQRNGRSNRRGAALDRDLNPRCFDLLTPSGFALAVSEICRCMPGSLVVIAICCNSFCTTSRHTAGRTVLRPQGNSGYVFVDEGNKLSSRVAAMLYLCAWKKLVWLVEQPDGSFLPRMPRWQTIWTNMEAFSGIFYMGAFGGPTPKRHRVWSNSKKLVDALNERAGHMSRDEQQKLASSTQLVTKYVDRNGVKRFQGKRDALRASQTYTKQFGKFLTRVAMSLHNDNTPGPKHPCDLPNDLTDFELFEKFCVQSSGEGLDRLGDGWADADLESVVKYLSGCKFLCVPGRWDQVMEALGLMS
ncbi:unnamed protein product [Effrenium voratum]|nr:unnamed protein product [Effrenium voratum]